MFSKAHLSVIPKFFVSCALVFDVYVVPLSVMMVVGKSQCFVNMSINTFAVFEEVASTSE